MYCRIVLLTQSLGGPKPLRPDKVAELRAIKTKLGL